MTERKPGEWPLPRVELPEPEPDRNNGDRARWHIVLGSIKADLIAQPSENCVRSAARRWQDAITQLSDEIVNQRRRHPG